MRCVAAWAAAVGSLGLVGCTWPTEAVSVDPVRAWLDAKTMLLQAAEDRDATTQVNAIEALAGTMGQEGGAVFVQALSHENPAVRFAAALAIGDVRYRPALATLQKLAEEKTGEPDRRTYCAVIYALCRLGDDSRAGDLGRLLFDREREVRMNAALAMGKLGEPSAIGPLNALLSTEQDEGVKIQLVESLALLGDSRSAEIIEAYTKGYFLDLRLVAIPALARAGSPRAAQVLTDLLEERHPTRVRVAAAGELARLGQPSQAGCELCIAAIRDPQRVLADAAKRSPRAADSDAASLRRLAAIALGWMAPYHREAAGELYPLLRSRDGGVRVASAMSLLRLLKAYTPPGPARMTKVAATQPAAGAAARAPAGAPASAAASRPARKLPALHTAGARD